MSEEIIKILDALAEKFGLAIDWTSTNVIPYLESLCGKYVNYEIATSVVWIVLMCIFSFCGYTAYKKFHKYEYDRDGDAILANLFLCSIVWISVLVICCQVFDIITCFTFPEKIIIEELKSIYTSIK